MIPELKVETDIEKLRAELGRKRYLAKKEQRKRKADEAKLDKPPNAERQMSINWIMNNTLDNPLLWFDHIGWRHNLIWLAY